MPAQKRFRRLSSELTDKEWEIIRHFLPPSADRGRPRSADRKIMNGILYVLSTGCRWEDIPPERYGSGKTCWKRFDRWNKEGAWQQIQTLLLLELNRVKKLHLTNTYLDGSVRQNKRGVSKKSATPASRRKTA